MAQTHLVTAVTFTGTTIDSIVGDVSVQRGALNRTDLKTDAAQNLQMRFIDGHFDTITVSTADIDFEDEFDLGAVGSLVVTRKARTNGKGTAVGTQTATYANAVLDDISSTTGESGQSQVTLTFIATDPSGSGLVTYA